MVKKNLLANVACLIGALSAGRDVSTLEFKPSYFVFQDEALSSVYSNGAFQFQVSGSKPVLNAVDVYASVGCNYAEGLSLNSSESTTLWQFPVDFGIKPIIRLNERLRGFIAFGPRLLFVCQKNDSQYIDPELEAQGFGAFLNCGINAYMAEHVVIGLFGEYAYTPASFSSSRPNVYAAENVQMGGYSIGMSLGYRF